MDNRSISQSVEKKQLGDLLSKATSFRSDTKTVVGRSPPWLNGHPAAGLAVALAHERAGPGTGGAQNEIERLVANGYLTLLRPCAPPDVEVTFKRGPKASDGKVPSLFRDGRWYGFPDWREYQPTPADALEWSKWPAPNFCLVTGVVAAFDIDVKFDPSDPSSELDRARSLIEVITRDLASRLGVPPAAIPRRTRSNSTSCALFVRLGTPVAKKSVAFRDAQTGTTHRVEFLAAGQQIVVSGTHTSGAPLNSTLSAMALQNVPIISPEIVTEFIAEIAVFARNVGYEVVTCPEYRKTIPAGPYTPEQAVTREIMRRRTEWLPDVLPVSLRGEHGSGEWRITSEELDRELEEDLAIYPDGIFDHGTERPHSPISFIREFGSIDTSGEIAFGGCPEYGPREGKPFAVIGEPDKNVRRPTEAEAITWLCRKLYSTDFPAFPAGTRWSAALPRVAAALGLDWDDLQIVHAWRWFEVIDETGLGRPIDPSCWSMQEFEQNSCLLPALQAIRPDRFEALRNSFAWDLAGITAEMIDQAISFQQLRVRQRAREGHDIYRDPQREIPLALPAPRDVFGDGNPTRLAEIPAGALPPVIEEWVNDVSERMGVPPAFAIGAALAAFSGAVGSKLRIQPQEFDTDWTEPAFLWFAIIEEPGGKKSPVIKAATKPLSLLDAEKAKEDGKKWAEWRERKSVRRRGELDPGPEPRIRRHVVESFTIEALTNVLKDNPAGVLVRQDELTQLIGSLDAYKTNKGSDRPMLLSLIDGGEMRVDRAGKGMTYVESWGASVIGGIQPKKIAEMSSGLDADGLLQRFIPIVGDGARRSPCDRTKNAAVLDAYAALLRRLAEAQPIQQELVRLSSEAQAIWRPLRRRMETLSALEDLSDAWRGHLGKWSGFSNRILLVLHAVERWGQGGADELIVSAATAQRGIHLVEWLLSHSIRFYEESVGPGQAGEDARWIAGHILAGSQVAHIRRRDIGQAKRELRSAPDRIVRAMRYLERMDWCTGDENERVDRYGPSRWDINPLVFSAFRPRADSERKRREDARSAIVVAADERRRIKGGQ